MSIIDFMIGGLVVIITFISLHGALLIVYDKQEAWETFGKVWQEDE